MLLDSQSTVDLFFNLDHVTNIRPATMPIRVPCNKGTLLAANEEGDSGNTPVCFDSRGIANVLSLYRLSQKFQVTYDRLDRGGVFQVHTAKGLWSSSILLKVFMPSTLRTILKLPTSL